MERKIARAYQRTPLLWLGAALSLLSGLAMVWGNIGSMAGASFSQLMVYVILPGTASGLLCVLMLLRRSPLLTVIPAALGCTIYVMLESYLTVFVTDPGSFAGIWSYLEPGSIVCILGASLCMAVGCLLYILCAMGLLHADLLPMAGLGLAAFFLLAEYLMTVLQGGYSASPWYMISAVLFMLALVLSVVCFRPEYGGEPVPRGSGRTKTSAAGKSSRKDGAKFQNASPDAAHPEDARPQDAD